MKTVFISNYINHHQIPFSDALYELLGEDYHFIQTEEMEAERVAMGWALDAAQIPYVVFADQEKERCLELIEEADLVLAGWTKRTDLFLPRMESAKLTIRISERIYREGQWKAISPRGLIAKYKEHIRFRNKPVYLLCAGAYVASDFSLIGAYPDKMLKFGYFPEMRRQDKEQLFERKRREAAEGLQLVWAGRFIELKHPEYVTRLAKELMAENRKFHVHLIGSGPMEARLKQEISAAGMEAHFTCYGFLKPDEVRDIMERCQIHLFTSNYLEGWGAVLNESMDSGCCPVANAQIGAVPYLITDGVNGCVYADGSYENFAAKVKELFAHPDRIEKLGQKACCTIAEEWNAKRAAKACVEFYEGWKAGNPVIQKSGPFSKAPVISARWKYDEGKL
ncbi:MAG: glycosyltransferase family 4 protein [Lachnospiraceae bacterium]|nr:glycosyltransferase family 4 protein [Lachnospiraceae bacterium]